MAGKGMVIALFTFRHGSGPFLTLNQIVTEWKMLYETWIVRVKGWNTCTRLKSKFKDDAANYFVSWSIVQLEIPCHNINTPFVSILISADFIADSYLGKIIGMSHLAFLLWPVFFNCGIWVTDSLTNWLTVGYFVQLARACGVPVGRHSGGRLATTLVATINVIIFSFLFFFFFSVVYFSHRRSARIKKLI